MKSSEMSAPRRPARDAPQVQRARHVGRSCELGGRGVRRPGPFFGLGPAFWAGLVWLVPLAATLLAPTRLVAQDGRDTEPAASGQLEFFETRIRPILVAHCYECHSAASAELQGGLRVDSRAGLRAGGDSGPAVVPGAPDESLLLDALRHESFEMPPGKQLPPAVAADFQRWIERGAADPRDAPTRPESAAARAWNAVFQQRLDWWSLQPLATTSPPDVPQDTWSRGPVDRFLLARLREQTLLPAPDADPLTLVRRLSFVLTGLPPSAEHVRAFPARYQADPDGALAALVDELLSSPHFGERFARHWMDVVRYTDTYGYEWDNPAKGSWEYRDYLIRAFHRDVGFDQLIREQLAGDLLPRPRIDRRAGVNESLIGPMFYHLGEHRHGDSLDFNGIHQEMINNKVDAFSKAFLAETVACARCHNHKLDAIAQRDYYALAGVFMSPRWTARAIDAPGKYAAEIDQLRGLREQIRGALAGLWRATPKDPVRAWAEGQVRQTKQQAGSSQESPPAPTREDVAYPLVRLAAAEDDAQAAETWKELAAEWRTDRDRRQAANAAKFQVLADFRASDLPDLHDLPGGWVLEGLGMEHGRVRDGTPLVALNGSTIVRQLLPAGYHTHALSSKLPGAVRLPAQAELSGRLVSLRLAGGEWAGHLVVPQNAFQTEAVTFLDRADPVWTSFVDKGHANGVSRILIEVATSALNPCFPPRTGKARAGGKTLPPDDDGLDKRSWFSLTGIVAHEAAGVPTDTLDAFAPLYEGPAPQTVDQVWQRVNAWFAAALQRWSDDAAMPGDVRCLNWLLSRGLLPNQLGDSPQLAELVARYRRVESRIGFPRTVNSMDERGVEPIDYRINIRGNVDEEGPAIPRDFLQAFAGRHEVAQSDGSGRLELARYLSHSHNPVTARVYVNRVWQWVFGTGLVATPNDFGKLGDRPSHPRLLDWLAAEFIRDGWSTKRLVRRLVLSRAFRQAGQVRPEAREADPDNRLLHHYPTRRLEAEAIRDALLVVSGRFDGRLYGPPTNPPRSSEDPQKRLFSGPLTGRGRRSLYTKMSIMEPPKFLVGFNLPDLKLPTGRRDVTNVPNQALILLNDPLVIRLAERWAERLLQANHADPAERIRAMFRSALGREPTEAEVRRWTAATADFASADFASASASSGEGHADAPDAAERTAIMQDQQAWTAIAHALFNTNEFIHYR